MVRLAPECYPCFLRQADLAAKAHGAAEEERLALADRVSRLLAGFRGTEVPARLASGLQEAIREALGTDDPFAALKAAEYARFPEASRRALAFVEGAPDPLAAAVGLSALANILDSGIVEEAVKAREIARIESMAASFALPGALRARIAEARTVVVLLDNAGEAAFDVPLLALLSRGGKRVRIAAKGGPVIDDLTHAEAVELGLGAWGELLSNGNRAIGTELDACPPAFRDALFSADLVLSKGQGNFETLAGALPNAWFLLRCKCPVVSRATGFPEGELMVLDGATRR